MCAKKPPLAGLEPTTLASPLFISTLRYGCTSLPAKLFDLVLTALNGQFLKFTHFLYPHHHPHYFRSLLLNSVEFPPEIFLQVESILCQPKVFHSLDHKPRSKRKHPKFFCQNLVFICVSTSLSKYISEVSTSLSITTVHFPRIWVAGNVSICLDRNNSRCLKIRVESFVKIF